jgi:endogenous inhibitor of DNA gyrase (YacG/DUF329 family)
MSTPLEFPVRAISRKCPICGKPTEAAFKPFCSKRCSDVDLGRWLNGSYTVPDGEDDERPPERDPSQ